MSDDDGGLDPLGVEFWLGQALLIAGATAGILLAARMGFSQATHLSRHEDARLAATALELVSKELDADLAAVFRAREALRAGRPARLTLSTDALDAAMGQGYMAIVDPAPLGEVELLFGSQVREIAARLGDGGLEPDEVIDAIQVLGRVWQKGHAELQPMLADELRRVRAEAGQ